MKEAMKDLITGWFHTPAEWWQFWLPQSGAVGGVLMGLAIILAGVLLWAALRA